MNFAIWHFLKLMVGWNVELNLKRKFIFGAVMGGRAAGAASPRITHGDNGAPGARPRLGEIRL